MGIPAEFDSLDFARRCIAARFHGREEAMVADLAKAGVVTTVQGVRDCAEFMGEAFRVGDPTKPNCYLCSAPVDKGQLCSCFKTATPGRHYNVNDVRFLAACDPALVVETYTCEDCGMLDHVTAEAARISHERNGAYKPRKFCGVHFAERKQAGRGKRGGKHHKSAQAAQQGVSAPPAAPAPVADQLRVMGSHGKPSMAALLATAVSSTAPASQA